jgi:hypothetical protein
VVVEATRSKNASNKHTTTAVASSRYKRGYIDKTGRFVIDPQFGIPKASRIALLAWEVMCRNCPRNITSIEPENIFGSRHEKYCT